MSLLSYWELKALVDEGVITEVKSDQINASSIDLTIGEHIKIEANDYNGQTVVLRDHDRLNMIDRYMDEDGYHLRPGQFILAHSEQKFNLPPNVSAEYKLKSSMARIGLEHLNAGWCDAGWHGSVLTLELKNMTQHHTIHIQPKDYIGQIVFFRHEPVPMDKSYAQRGRYNNDGTVTGAKK